MRLALDTSAVLLLAQEQEGWAEVYQLLRQREHQFFVPAPVLTELGDVARFPSDVVRALRSFEVLNTDRRAAEIAAEVHQEWVRRFKRPQRQGAKFDLLIAATAQRWGMDGLVATDPDYQELPLKIPIHQPSSLNRQGEMPFSPTRR